MVKSDIMTQILEVFIYPFHFQRQETETYTFLMLLTSQIHTYFVNYTLILYRHFRKYIIDVQNIFNKDCAMLFVNIFHLKICDQKKSKN